MGDTYIVLADWGNSETTEEVNGYEEAERVAQMLIDFGGAIYTAVIDKDGRRVVEFGGDM